MTFSLVFILWQTNRGRKKVLSEHWLICNYLPGVLFCFLVFLVLVFFIRMRASVSPVSSQKKKTVFHTMKVWKPFLDAKSLPKTPIKLKAADFRSPATRSRRRKLELPFVFTSFRYSHPLLTRNGTDSTHLCNLITISTSTWRRRVVNPGKKTTRRQLA